MKIISYSSARATWLFPTEEIAPLEGFNGRNIIEDIAMRYGFENKPSTNVARDELSKSGLRFEAGHMGTGKTPSPITEFLIYPDGVVASAPTTNIGHEFLVDIMNWLQSEFKFRPLTSKLRELFLSELVVEFDSPLSGFIHGFQAISDAISRLAGPAFATTEKIGFARIDLEFDKTNDNVKLQPPRFIIERRPNTSFDRERYFCSAPLQTEEHIEVLQQIEKSIPRAKARVTAQKAKRSP